MTLIYLLVARCRVVSCITQMGSEFKYQVQYVTRSGLSLWVITLHLHMINVRSTVVRFNPDCPDTTSILSKLYGDNMENSFNNWAQPRKAGGSVPLSTEPDFINSDESTGSPCQWNCGEPVYAVCGKRCCTAGIYNCRSSLVSLGSRVHKRALTHLNRWGAH